MVCYSEQDIVELSKKIGNAFVGIHKWKTLKNNEKFMIAALNIEQKINGKVTEADIAKAVRYYRSPRKPLRDAVEEEIVKLKDKGILHETEGGFLVSLAQVLMERGARPPRSTHFSEIKEIIGNSKATNILDLVREICEKTGIKKSNIYKYLHPLVWWGEVKPTIGGLKLESWKLLEYEIR